MRKEIIDAKVLSKEISKCEDLYIRADSQRQIVERMFEFDDTFIETPTLFMSASMELAFRDDSGMELSIESAQQIMTTRGYLTQRDFKYV